MKTVLKAFFWESTAIFMFAWMILGSAIAAKTYGRFDQANRLFLLFFLIFLANGFVNLLIWRLEHKPSLALPDIDGVLVLHGITKEEFDKSIKPKFEDWLIRRGKGTFIGFLQETGIEFEQRGAK